MRSPMASIFSRFLFDDRYDEEGARTKRNRKETMESITRVDRKLQFASVENHNIVFLGGKKEDLVENGENGTYRAVVIIVQRAIYVSWKILSIEYS